MTLILGAHESIAGGMSKAFDRAQSVGCESVQIFVKSNRAWAAKPLTDEDIERFRARAEESGIQPVVGHASYLLNLGTPDEELWKKSRDVLILELQRCEVLGVGYLVLHPGSHVGSGDEVTWPGCCLTPRKGNDWGFVSTHVTSLLQVMNCGPWKDTPIR